MKKLAIILFVLTLGSGVHAQQRPQYALYFQNNYILNPALSGIEEFYDTKLSYRSQWVGINGAPVTSYFSIQGPTSSATFNDAPRAHGGIGATVIQDQTGPTGRLTANASFAYHVLLSESVKISLGLSGGVTQYTLKVNQLVFDQAFDPAAPKAGASQIVPDLTAGVWIYGEQFFVGGSINQLLPSQINYGTSDKNPQNALRSHQFVTAGIRIPLGETITYTPSIMVKRISPAPISFDFNNRFQFGDKFWLGGSYRRGDGFSACAGFYVNSLLNVSYAYDYTASPLQSVTSGSHEIILGLQLFNPSHVRCPKMNW